MTTINSDPYTTGGSLGNMGAWYGGGSMGAYTGLVGTVMSAWSSYMQGQAMEEAGRMANSQARFESALYDRYASYSLIEGDIARNWGEFNALSAETDAINVQIATQRAMTRIRKEGSKLQGTQVAHYAKANVEIDTGTPHEVIKDSADAIQTDLANIMAAGRMEQWGHEVQARISRLQGEQGAIRAGFQSGNYSLQGGQAIITGQAQDYQSRYQAWAARFKGINSLLTGATRFGVQTYQAPQYQVFDYA